MWHNGVTGIPTIAMKSAKDKREPSPSLERLATALGPIHNEGLTEHIVRRMKEIILEGVLRPGDRLPPERDLSMMLNVSRSSLRQALKAFQVMGVLEVRQGSGNYLTENAPAVLREPQGLLVPLSGVSFAELFEARRAIEAESAACAAKRARRTEIDEMENAILRMKASRDNFAKFAEHDAAFHRAIAVASGNGVFEWFVTLIQQILMEAHIAHARVSKLPGILDAHRRILDAIRARDSEQARNEMLAHLVLSQHYTDRTAPFELRGFAAESNASEES